MHLQENTLYDLNLGVKVTQNVAQYSLHHVTYAPAKFEVAAFTRKVKKIYFLTFVQYPLHHVTNAPAKFEVAVSNAFDGDAFTRKYIICP